MKYMKQAKKSSANDKHTKPLTKKEEVQANPDEHIDQDFPGYPHPHAQENIINPTTQSDKAGANLIKKEKKQNTDQLNSDGSANAFEASENDDEVLRDELNQEEDTKDNKQPY
jgi:hypothetical protein